MSAKDRSATPVPSEKLPGVAAEQGGSAGASSADAVPQKNGTKRTENVAPRSCTDLLCLIIFLLLAAFLSRMLYTARQQADLRKLTRGFDHRGHLCGASEVTRGRNLTYWCPKTGDASDTALDWTAPVCISKCPTEGEIMECPTGGVEVTETREKGRRGLVTLRKVEEVKLAPMKAPAEARLWMNNFCVPADFDASRALLDALPSNQNLDLKHSLPLLLNAVSRLLEAPRVLAACVAVAITCSFVYLLFLKLFAGPFVRLSFLVTALLCFISGISLLVSAGLFEVLGLQQPGWLDDIVLNEGRVIRGFIGRHAVLLSAAQRGLGSYGPVCAGVGGGVLCIIGLGLIFILVVARKILSMAVDCVSDACRILFTMPTLLILPLIEATLSLGAWLLLIGGLPILIARTEVKAETIVGISGLFRVFDLGIEDYNRIAVWVFGCLWLQEVIGALCAFALSYTVAIWYFTPKGDSRIRILPMLRGLMCGAFFHLGSLAFGAFGIALFRFFRYILVVLERTMCAQRKDGAMRLIHSLFGICHMLLAFLQKVAEYINGYAYVDIALTSGSFYHSALNAASLMGSNAAVMGLLSGVCSVFQLTGQAVLTTGAGFGAFHLMHVPEPQFLKAIQRLGRIHPSLGSQARLLYGEMADLESPVIVAAAAALSMLLVSRAVLSCVDGAAQSLLYCFLWDASDGVVDAVDVPQSFKDFKEFKNDEKEKQA